MSNKELAIKLLDQIPESKMYYVVSFLQGAAIPEEIPNQDTLDAFHELQQEKNIFDGSTEDFLKMMLED